MFDREQLQKGGELFFHLLKNQVLPITDSLAYDFVNNPDIQEIVNHCRPRRPKGLLHQGEHTYGEQKRCFHIRHFLYTNEKQI